MKYNDDLFNMSSEYYSQIDKDVVDNIDETVINLEKELLVILLRRFRNTLNDESIEHNGILKVRFLERAYKTEDSGYYQIQKLVKLGRFDSFASQYCIYIRDDVFGWTCGDSYYDVIWDYGAYFESLSMHEIGKNIEVKEGTNYGQNEMLSSIALFKNLSINRQLSVIKSFIHKVKKEYELEKKELIEAECMSKGHDYSKWRKINYSTLWERTCSRCGDVKTVYKKPRELADSEKNKVKVKRLKKNKV